MRYEWDERKNRANRRKHAGISFEAATLVFQDPRCLIAPDRADETGERRWLAIGMAQIEPNTPAVLFVVHTYREDHDGEEIIRIVSARKAEKHERRRYQEQEVD